MPPTVYALHTSFALVELFRPLFAEILPKARLVNVVDDSLLADVRAAGGLTANVTRRIVGYATLAQASGASALFNCCSSVGEAADVAQRTLDIPVVKVDEAMAEQAAAQGPRLAVIATVPTTLAPTVRLIRSKARGALHVRERLVEGAFDLLVAGRKEEHDQAVAAEIRRAATEADAVVLAQASMARLVPQLTDVTTPILTSPRSGVERLAHVLAGGS